MKTFFTLLTVSLLTLPCFAQTNVSPAQNVTSISTLAVPAEETLVIKENEHDFGKIPQGKPVTYVFEIQNTGTTPLKLDNVQASCGCTTPVWNKEDIAPGAVAQITVGYNAQNEGEFTKPVTITYNGNQTKQIIIKGDVWSTPDASAPTNNSINTLNED